MLWGSFTILHYEGSALWIWGSLTVLHYVGAGWYVLSTERTRDIIEFPASVAFVTHPVIFYLNGPKWFLLGLGLFPTVLRGGVFFIVIWR